MKATNWYKKLILSSVMAGSFLVFGGVYQGLKITDTSYMENDEVKFVKRFDESKERVLASAVNEVKAIQYLPVNEANNSLINGKWIITRIEDENENEVYNKSNSDKRILVDFNLVRTSQIMINDDSTYLFDLSFLHESGKTIALFRSFGKGYEIIEARRYKEEKYIQAVSNISKEESFQKLEKSQDIRTVSSEPMSLERAMIPTIGNTPVVLGTNRESQQEVRGNLTVANGAIQGLNFTVTSKEGKTVSYDLGDIELTEAGSFIVEINAEKSSGIVTNNGKDAYRIRFVSGPLKGALLNFSTPEEIERIAMEREEIERLKEEKMFESEISGTALDQVEASNSRKQSQGIVIDAGFKEQKVERNIEELDESELTDEEWNELYGEEVIAGEEEMTQEVVRQGFGF